MLLEYSPEKSLPNFLGKFMEDRANNVDQIAEWRTTRTNSMLPEKWIYRIFSDLALASLVAVSGSDALQDVSPADCGWNSCFVHLDLNPMNCLVDATSLKEEEPPRVVWASFENCRAISRGSSQLDYDVQHGRLVFNQNWTPPVNHSILQGINLLSDTNFLVGSLSNSASADWTLDQHLAFGREHVVGHRALSSPTPKPV